MINLNYEQSILLLRERLKAALPGSVAHQSMLHAYRYTPPVPPDDAKQSAVLLVLYPTAQNKTGLLLIERTKDGSPHSGQIALPGGRYEEKDGDLQNTAIRETFEEINLQPENIEILGKITPMYIPVSNFCVHPYIGICNSLNGLLASDDEVAQIIHTDLETLFQQKGTVKIALVAAPNGVIKAPAYLLPNNKYIWGATAMIIAELEYILLNK